MSGQRIKIGARETYFPPFVNELFDGPPYWACTFAALLNGANVGFLGNRPPTHDEVRKLALASGDVDLKGGAQSSEMVRAMRVHYRKEMQVEALPPRRVHERLSSGWAMVGAVTYGEIPMPWRRHAPRFRKGHRITLIGWNGKETWILDPMAREGTDYTGEPIPWSVLEPAWWRGEQLWFAEGMFRTPPKVKVVEEVPNGTWRIPAGSRLVARLATNARVIMRKVILAEPRSGRFDAIVEVIQRDGTSMGEFLRVSSGRLKDTLIPVRTKRIVIRPKPGPAPKPASTNPESPDFLAGRQAQYDIIRAYLGPAVSLPPRPK